MDCFANAVLPSLRSLGPFYEGYDVGNLEQDDEQCWVAFGPMAPRNNEYRYVPHQTISLTSDGLHVFVNAELLEAMVAVKRVLTRSPSSFRRALQALHEPFELVLGERVQHQAMLFDYVPKFRLHSSLLAEDIGNAAWRAFAQTVDLIHLPYLNVDCHIRPPALVDPVRAVQRVVEVLQHNDAVVQLLNGHEG